MAITLELCSNLRFALSVPLQCWSSARDQAERSREDDQRQRRRHGVEAEDFVAVARRSQLGRVCAAAGGGGRLVPEGEALSGESEVEGRRTLQAEVE